MYRVETNEDFFKRFESVSKRIKRASVYFQNPDVEISRDEYEELFDYLDDANYELECLIHDARRNIINLDR